MKPTDFVNTGKVVIGRAYAPKPRPLHEWSDDAILLQNALLDRRTAKRPGFLRRFIRPIIPVLRLLS